MEGARRGLFLLFLVGLVFPVISFSAETDQFTVPQQPLVDVGPDLENRFREALTTVMTKLNKKIDESKEDLFGGESRSELLSMRKFATEVYKEIGIGLPTCPIEDWLNSHRFAVQPARHSMTFLSSIYVAASGLRVPGAFGLLAPTLNIHGVYLGSDKLGHMIQQGYEYLEKYLDSHRDIQVAVDYGVMTENSFFGLALTGVYSNADLVANYMGMHLYLNLLEEVQVEGKTLLPIFKIRNGHWVWNEERESKDFLKPFISNRLNEALNPSYFDPIFRIPVIRQILKRKDSACSFFRTESESISEDYYKSIQGKLYGHRGDDDELPWLGALCKKGTHSLVDDQLATRQKLKFYGNLTPLIDLDLP